MQSIIRAVDIFVAIGLGMGLAPVAGVRAFLPLAMLYWLTLLEGPFLPIPVPYGVVVGMLLLLAVLETVLDKILDIDHAFNIVMVPVRAVSGALLFAGMVGLTVDLQSSSLAAEASRTAPWLVAGAVVAGVVAVLKIRLRPTARTPSTGVSVLYLSACEDVVALVGSVLAFIVPFLGILLVAFLPLLYRLREPVYQPE